MRGGIIIKKFPDFYEFEDLALIRKREEELEERETRKMIFRICSKCGERKITSKFTRDRRSKNGRTKVCKVCQSRESLRRYYEDVDRVKIGGGLYRESHKEERKIYNEKYRIAHKEELKERAKKWYEQNKKAIKKRSLLYYNEHKEECRITREIWRLVNREKIKKYNKEYKKKQKEREKLKGGRYG